MKVITIPIPSSLFILIYAIISSAIAISFFVYYGDPTDQRSLSLDFPEHYFTILFALIFLGASGNGLLLALLAFFITDHIKFQFKSENKD